VIERKYCMHAHLVGFAASAPASPLPAAAAAVNDDECLASGVPR
jgi:hypothetical protein